MSLYGGLRLGEVLGLRWSNVDITNGIIFVQDQQKSGIQAHFHHGTHKASFG